MNFLKVLFSLIHKLFFMLSSSILFSSIRFAHFFSYYLKLSAKCIWLFQKWIRIIFIIYFGRYIRRPVLFEPLALSTIIILWFIRYCLFSYFNIWLIFLQPFSAVYFIHHNLSGTLDFYRFKRNPGIQMVNTSEKMLGSRENAWRYVINWHVMKCLNGPSALIRIIFIYDIIIQINETWLFVWCWKFK